MKKLSLVLLLGLFSCRNIKDDYLIIKKVEKTSVHGKYEITLTQNQSDAVYFPDLRFFTDSLYSVGDSIKIGK